MRLNSISPRQVLLVLSLISASFMVQAGTAEQAKRIHERLTGSIPSEATLLQMEQAITNSGGEAAALIAMENDNFYRVTLKNWIAPWTNRDQDVFVDLNDYIATVMGFVEDERDFRGILYEDALYTVSGVTPAYAVDNNDHYISAEATDPSTFSLKDSLSFSTQSSVTGLPSNATAGVLTSRAAAQAFFIDGTNRAMFRYTLLNHLCIDLEQVQDPSLPPDRIRQDVSRSPGGDSRVFVNNCVTCHAGMDPMAQAFAYYDYDDDGIVDEDGNQVVAATNRILYNRVGDVDIDETTNEVTSQADPDFPNLQRVQRKYHINNTTFSAGFVTPDDRWDNYWRGTANGYLGWNDGVASDGTTNAGGTGNGAKSLGIELAHSNQFAQCQVEKVFKAVCLRDPINTADGTQVTAMVSNFQSGGYNLKNVFAQAADYCKGN